MTEMKKSSQKFYLPRSLVPQRRSNLIGRRHFGSIIENEFATEVLPLLAGPETGVGATTHFIAPLAEDSADLMRLYGLVRSRRVTTILEFGVGHSTRILAHALRANRQEFGNWVDNNLRRGDAFKLFSVDDSEKWIEIAQGRIEPEVRRAVTFLYSQVETTVFNGRICTQYESLPNICPDFIYLDGPSQDFAVGDVNGISTRHSDRLPMACDILKIEHFLLPGTLIVVDGRTANVRFLSANLQRNWWHHHDRKDDVHFLELRETSLGRFNEKQIRFCLGDHWPGL